MVKTQTSVDVRRQYYWCRTLLEGATSRDLSRQVAVVVVSW
jgi:hypothetical protein